MKRIGYIILILFLMNTFLLPSISPARIIRTSGIGDEFLKKKNETINQIVRDIMASERGTQLVEDIQQGLSEFRIGDSYRLPIEIKEVMVPAGHGYEYKVNIFILEKDETDRAFIGVDIYGDTEAEGFAEDPSCWDRTKVIIRCVIQALRECGLQIESQPAPTTQDPYWYNYYYIPPE